MTIKEMKNFIPKEYRKGIYTIRENKEINEDGKKEAHYYIFLKYGYYWENECGGSYMIEARSLDEMVLFSKDIAEMCFDNIHWYDWMRSPYVGHDYITKCEYMDMIKEEIAKLKFSA